MYEVYVVGDQESSWPEVVAGPVDRWERWPGLTVRLVGSFEREDEAFRLLEKLLVADATLAVGEGDR